MYTIASSLQAKQEVSDDLSVCVLNLEFVELNSSEMFSCNVSL